MGVWLITLIKIFLYRGSKFFLEYIRKCQIFIVCLRLNIMIWHVEQQLQ